MVNKNTTILNTGSTLLLFLVATGSGLALACPRPLKWLSWSDMTRSCRWPCLPHCEGRVRMRLTVPGAEPSRAPAPFPASASVGCFGSLQSGARDSSVGKPLPHDLLLLTSGKPLLIALGRSPPHTPCKAFLDCIGFLLYSLFPNQRGMQRPHPTPPPPPAQGERAQEVLTMAPNRSQES